MTGIIDADAHVVESERTWDFMLEEDQPHRPSVLAKKNGTADDVEYWMIEGRVYPKNTNIGHNTTEATREASNIKARLAHMDELGVAVHVLYPSLFLRPLSDHPEVELALVRGYNRWLAQIWEQGEGRLRWPVIVPVFDREAAIDELHFGKEHGACGVFMRGIQGDHRLTDPWFFPLYQEAMSLDMPICVHAATGNFDSYDFFLRDSGFAQFKLPAVGAFHDIVMKRMHERFPDLRWAFVEISASWVPYAMNDLMLRFGRKGWTWPGSELLAERNIYVACQTADDLDYILDSTGDEHVVIGTDYGHNDTSSEIHALRRLRERGGLSGEVVDKMLTNNPTRLYAL